MLRHANPLSAALALALAVTVPAGTATLSPTAAIAQQALPAPYVSRALDAVLLPVDGAVISAFGLATDAKGVLVLATQPGGLAESAGILPGDVIDFVRGRPVLSPLDLDEVVYYWILQGVTDFVFDGLRAGSGFASETVITLEYWEEVIEITEISTWSAYSSESFSYEEFYSEYSEDLSASYEESLTTIEETVTSDSYAEEMSSEDTTGATEAPGDEAADCPGEIVDGVCVEEDPAMDAAPGDEAVDDGGDAGGDDGGDGGGEEEIIEE